ncbi:MAG: phosphate signaling complex protein PhoU [Deltaproteobacteria bacterium]|nr:phosphate signaling complex protein PhoU [Deltaproteobacteria bacterium]
MSESQNLKYFDVELGRLHGKVVEMGRAAKTQLEGALASLEKQDRRRAWRTVEGDERVNTLKHELDYDTVRLLALQQPVARDLRSIISALKMSIDLERAADYAAGVAKSVLELETPLAPEHQEALLRMGRVALEMFDDILAAYDQQDTARARAAWEKDNLIDKEYVYLLGEAKKGKAGCENAPSPAAVVQMARSLERIGDHLTNSAEHVHFLLHGTAMNHQV